MKMYSEVPLIIVAKDCPRAAYIDVTYNRDLLNTCGVHVVLRNFVDSYYGTAPTITKDKEKNLVAILGQYDAGVFDEGSTISRIEEVLFEVQSNSP